MFEHLDSYFKYRTWRGGQGFWRSFFRFGLVNKKSWKSCKKLSGWGWIILKCWKWNLWKIWKIWKLLKKDLQVCYKFYDLFEKIAFEEVISSSNYFLIFLRLNSSVVGLFIAFLTSGLDFGKFWEGKVWRAPKCLLGFVVIYRMIGGIWEIFVL